MSIDARPGNPNQVRVIVHPPDKRGRRASVPAQAGPCCCSCCCCCLHSLGGLIGAAVAPNLGRGAPPGDSTRNWDLMLAHYWDEEEDGLAAPADVAGQKEGITAEDPSKAPQQHVDIPPPSMRERPLARPASRISAVSIFWLSSVVVVALAAVGLMGWMVVEDPRARGQDFFIVVGVLILLGLPGLQLAAAIVTAVILAIIPRQDKGYQFWQLGKIVIGAVTGTVIGILIMVGIVILMGWL